MIGRRGRRYVLTLLIATAYCLCAGAASYTIYPGKTYYTAEPEAIFVVRAPAIGRDSVLALSLDGRELACKEVLRAGECLHLKCDISDVPVGRHRVEVTWSGREGKARAQAETALVKLPAASEGNEVKVDRIHGHLLLNGKPFIPYGFTLCRPFQPDDLARIRNAGCRCSVAWSQKGNQDADDGLASMAAANDLGLYLFDKIDRYGRGNRQFWTYASSNVKELLHSMMEQDSFRIAGALRVSPALVGWVGFDEPDSAFGKGLPLQAEMARLRDGLREAAPYHPFWVNFNHAIPEGFLDTLDIASMDPYMDPLRNGKTPLFLYSPRVLKPLKACRHAGKAFFLVLQGGASHERSARPLTPKEQRCQTYLALILGARGICYFQYPVCYAPLWDTFAALSREIDALTPVLCTPELSVDVRTVPEESPSVAVAVRRSGTSVYLVTANGNPTALRVRMVLPGMSRRTRVKVMFEERVLACSAEGFTDGYDGYGTHVYELSGLETGRNLQELVLHVATLDDVSETTQDRAELTEHDNMLANPGFERGLEGWMQAPGSSAKALADRYLDGEHAHAGQACLRISRSPGKERSSYTAFMSEPLWLKPATRYRFGAHMRADITEGTEGPRVSMYWRLDDGRQQAHIVKSQARTPGRPSGMTRWTRYSGEFRTFGGAPTEFRFYCTLRSFGQAWFDDVFVVEVPEHRDARNLLRYSSFERCDAPGWPDYWWPHWDFMTVHATERFTGGSNPCWGTDAAERFHGSLSLRVVNLGGNRTGKPLRAPSRNREGDRIPLEADTWYTLSAYLKADREGVPVRLLFRAKTWQFEDVEVGTAWQRFTLTVKNDRVKPIEFKSVRIDLMGKGVLWIDAVQLEKGKSATEYQYLP